MLVAPPGESPACQSNNNVVNEGLDESSREVSPHRCWNPPPRLVIEEDGPLRPKEVLLRAAPPHCFDALDAAEFLELFDVVVEGADVGAEFLADFAGAGDSFVEHSEDVLPDWVAEGLDQAAIEERLQLIRFAHFSHRLALHRGPPLTVWTEITIDRSHPAKTRSVLRFRHYLKLI